MLKKSVICVAEIQTTMKDIISKLASALFCLMLLAGCQSADYKDSKLTVPTRVLILFSPPQKSYMIIGRVAVNRPHRDPRFGYDSSQSWQDGVQRQAGAMGADAVIIDTMSLNNINSVLVTSTAIRFPPEPPPSPK
jgi:hypothetical protein